MERDRNRGLSIVGPFILIGLGIVLLLQQLNIIQWSIWEVAFRLWPLIIIAVGADILIARRSFLGAMLSLALVLGLLAGGLYLMGTPPARTEGLTSENVAYPLKDAETGRIDVSFDAGQLEIGALPVDSENVLEGTLRGGKNNATSSVRVENSMVAVVLRRNWPGRFLYTGNDDFLWTLGVTRTIPLDITLSMGAGQIEADLTNLQVASVNVRLGAGQVVLRLPPKSAMDVRVSLGAGQVEIYAPDGVPLDVRCTTGVGNCELPNGSGFWGQNYTSPGYATAEDQIRIEISVGVGEAHVSN
jgi:hypothetical protein